MSFEIAAAALAQPATAAAGAGAGAAAQPMQAGYGVSLSDFNGFAQSMAQAGQRLEARPVSAPTEAAKQLMKPFEHINGEANQLAILAKDAQAAGQEGRPARPRPGRGRTARRGHARYRRRRLARCAGAARRLGQANVTKT